jgi:uncharacterized membrane protein
MSCIDRLGASLRLLLERRLPSPYHYDSEGTLRVIAKQQTFDGALDAAANLIRQYGAGSVAVSLRLMETLTVLVEYARSPRHKDALSRHARMLATAARVTIREPGDLEALEERYRMMLAALEGEPLRHTMP